MKKSQKVVIIGAGYAGLALANLLQKKATKCRYMKKTPSQADEYTRTSKMGSCLISALRGT